VYLPKIKTLLEADAYNPPAQASTPPPTPVSPYTANIVSAIDRLKLDVQTIIPVHYAARRSQGHARGADARRDSRATNCD
jgi:hypothetical protein